LTRDLAEQFNVDAIVDTGDLTTFGNPLEANFGELVAGMPAPYLLVPGNHDSFANRRTLDQSQNLELLDGTTATVDGVEILGMGDPVFTASNDVPPDEVDAALADQAIETRNLVREHDPDILAVHDPRQAEVALGEVPLVIAGHLHETTFEERDGTIVLTVGSTGATGLGSFTVDADLAYEAEVLHFDDGRLVALDTIALRGTEGEFRIDRRLLDPDRDESEPESRGSWSPYTR
jgi:predicted phosphodiesterase